MRDTRECSCSSPATPASPSAAGAAHAAQATKSEQSAQSTKSKQSKKSKTNEQSTKSTTNAKKKRGARRPPGHAEEDPIMNMMGLLADAELEADAAALYAVSDDGGMRYYHSDAEFASDGEGF